MLHLGSNSVLRYVSRGLETGCSAPPSSRRSNGRSTGALRVRAAARDDAESTVKASFELLAACPPRARCSTNARPHACVRRACRCARLGVCVLRSACAPSVHPTAAFAAAPSVHAVPMHPARRGRSRAMGASTARRQQRAAAHAPAPRRPRPAERRAQAAHAAVCEGDGARRRAGGVSDHRVPRGRRRHAADDLKHAWHHHHDATGAARRPLGCSLGAPRAASWARRGAQLPRAAGCAQARPRLARLEPVSTLPPVHSPPARPSSSP